jgi:DNA-binding NarL/FixJ family response regulator
VLNCWDQTYQNGGNIMAKTKAQAKLKAKKPTKTELKARAKAQAKARAELAKISSEAQRGVPRKQLPNEERRRIILEALAPGANITKIAREHSINRATLYEYLDTVLKDPKGRLADAEDEVSFLRQVWEIVR